MKNEIEHDARVVVVAAAPYFFGSVAAAVEYLLKSTDTTHLSPPLAVFYPMVAGLLTAVVLPRLRARAK